MLSSLGRNFHRSCGELDFNAESGFEVRDDFEILDIQLETDGEFIFFWSRGPPFFTIFSEIFLEMMVVGAPESRTKFSRTNSWSLIGTIGSSGSLIFTFLKVFWAESS